MKLTTTTALTLVAGLSAAPAAAQYGASAQQTVPPPTQGTGPSSQQPAAPAQPSVKASSKALKAIVDLQDTVNKNDLANLPAKVAAAQAVASTKEDRYLIGQLQLKAALTAKDNVAIASAVDAVAASGYLAPAKVAELYVSAGTMLYNNKQFPQAATAFQKAAASNPADPQAAALLGEAQFAQGQKAEAVASFQRAVQARVAAGQKPDEALLKRALSIAYESGSPAAAELGRQWITFYPSPNSWRNSVAIYRNLNHPDVEGTLDLLRLLQTTGALTDAGDYALYARAAVEQNNYNEAQAVVDAGIAAKVIDPSKAEYRDLIAGLKTKSKATAADLALATKTAQSGTALLRIGDRYASMGDYAKAVELYRMSMGKPGVDTAVVNLHIGMALARAGDKAGATTALNAVTGPRADIAKYWLMYLNTKA